jgi:hypothetical protein
MYRWILVLLLSGCTVLGSKEATIGCQSADTITTIIALHSGAVEANPLMAGVISALGIPGLILVKLGLILLLNRDDVPQEARVAANVITCGVAVHNLGI